MFDRMDKTLDNKNIAWGIICTLSGGVLWGFSGTCSQFLFSEYNMDAGFLTTLRMIFSGIILIVWGFICEKDNMINIWKDKKSIFSLLLFSVFGLMFCQVSYLEAIAASNASTATILQYLGPVLIMIVTCIILKQIPNLIECISVIFAVGGTFILATHGNINTMVLTTKGLVWGIFAAVALMLYSMLPVKIIKKFSAVSVTGYGMLIGGIVMLFVSRAWEKGIVINIFSLLAIAEVIILGTVLAYTLYLEGVRIIGAVKASMIACIEPVAATVFAVLWLKTSFNYIDLIGFVLILSTVFLISKPMKEQ